MKAGSENRKKTIMAGAFGAAALISVFIIYSELFGGSTPNPAAAPTVTISGGSASDGSTATGSTTHKNSGNTPALATAPGVDAKIVASTSSSLDPTLDETAMLRTESLVYSGTGRNIFSANSTASIETAIPTKAPSARNKLPPPPTTVYVPPTPPTCPPSCPPINLKFFGTATRGNGLRQAFLLDGEDVYLASQGEIVARKYKIVSISANSIQVEDLSNHNTQTLPLTSN